MNRLFNQHIERYSFKKIIKIDAKHKQIYTYEIS